MSVIFTSKVFAAEPNILTGNDLSVGTDGSHVVALQGLLSEMGYLTVPSDVAYGHFGSLTKNALARYQASRGVTPAVGYFGPVTKVSMYTDYLGHGWLALLGWNQ